MHGPPLTALAHEKLSEVIRPGDVVIDATAGNGHDTLFLARRVGTGGVVFAFDPQPQALELTRRRLAENGVEHTCRLLSFGHEEMKARIDEAFHGEVKAVVFNLGYLPGGDKVVTTRPETTLAALDQCLELLRPDGAISLLIYKGHPEGKREAEAIGAWMKMRPELVCESFLSVAPDEDSPELRLIRMQGGKP